MRHSVLVAKISFSPLTRIRLPQSDYNLDPNDVDDDWFQSPDEDSLTPKEGLIPSRSRIGKKFQSPDEDSLTPKHYEQDRRGLSGRDVSVP